MNWLPLVCFIFLKAFCLPEFESTNEPTTTTAAVLEPVNWELLTDVEKATRGTSSPAWYSENVSCSYLNLDRSHERRAAMETVLNGKSCSRFKAFDGRSGSQIPIIQSKLSRRTWQSFGRFDKGVAALTLTHLSVLERHINSTKKDQPLLVFEDDAELRIGDLSGFNIDSMVKNLNKKNSDWEIVLLFLNMWGRTDRIYGKKRFNGDNEVDRRLSHPTRMTFGFVALLWSPKGMRKVIKKSKFQGKWEIRGAADVVLLRKLSKRNSYVMIPPFLNLRLMEGSTSVRSSTTKKRKRDKVHHIDMSIKNTGMIINHFEDLQATQALGKDRARKLLEKIPSVRWKLGLPKVNLANLKGNLTKNFMGTYEGISTWSQGGGLQGSQGSQGSQGGGLQGSQGSQGGGLQGSQGSQGGGSLLRNTTNQYS